MPDSVLGFTRDEFIDRVLDTIGRSDDSSLRTRMQTDINFAQLAFWKMNDWKFAHKNGVTDLVKFTLQTGVSTYTLNTATVGYEIRNTEIDRVYIIDPSYARTLDRITLREIRSIDPSRQATGAPSVYSESHHNQIEVWQIPDASVNGIDVYIDAKVMPAWLTNGTDYTNIPVEYQETFYQYFLYRTLSRERDPRQKEELQIFKDMLKTDVEFDGRELENTLHIKLPGEERQSTAYPGIPNVLKRFDRDF
jgi:hypothetical protein